MLIGITGTNGAGKGTVVKILQEKYGFTHYSVRDILHTELTKQNREITRKSLQDIANELREKFGNDVLVKKILEKNTHKNIIIDSVRTKEGFQYIKKQGGLIIAVDANIVIRFERITKRHSQTDSVSFEEFQKEEQEELNQKTTFSQNLSYCIKNADILLENNGTVQDLEKELAKYENLFKI